MTDPRKARTREHVLRAAGRVLAQRTGEPLTFSALALEARVSRRTLYVHWGTIDALIRDLVESGLTDRPVVDDGLSPRARLRTHLTAVRDTFADPVNSVALPALLHDATQSDASAELVVARGTIGLERFRTVIGELTEEQYAQLVGPLAFVQFVTRVPASDEFVATLVEQGLVLLGLADDHVAA